MKNLIIITYLVFSISVVGFSQVKEKFRDSTNTSTIVVVKEEGAIDQQVLNDYFDLSEMSMSDQIRITTVPTEAPNMEEASASIDNDIELFFEVEEEEKKDTSTAEASPEVVGTVNVVAEVEQQVEQEVKSNAIAVKNKVNKAPSRAKAKGNYQIKSSYEVKKAAKKKYFAKKKSKRRKSINKRKRSKNRRSKSCYSF